MKNMKERFYPFFKINWLVLFVCFIYATNVYAQDKEVTGVITGEDNEPLAGATVKIKNSQGGVIADLDGKFTLKAKLREILEVSFLGMEKQEIKVDNRNFYVIKLRPLVMNLMKLPWLLSPNRKKKALLVPLVQ